MSDLSDRDYLNLAARIEREPVFLVTTEWTEADWQRLERALDAAYIRRIASLN